MRSLLVVIVAALAGVLTACAGANPATHFCDDYGNAMRGLYAAAGNYAAAPGEFATVADATLDDLSRIRAGAPSDELRRAFDSAHFALTVFNEDATLADFLVRTDFANDDVVKACADNGIELKPDEG